MLLLLGQLCSEQLSGGDNDDDDGKISTAGAALLAILIIVVVVIIIIVVFLVVKHLNKTQVSSGSFDPKFAEGADNRTVPKDSEFLQFTIPRAKLERLI